MYYIFLNSPKTLRNIITQILKAQPIRANPMDPFHSPVEAWNSLNV